MLVRLSCLVLLLLLSPGPAHAWLTASQARFAASPEDFALAARGLSTATAFGSLGWIWTLPSDPLDERGLGASITYAIDPALCAELLPRVAEGFWTNSFVDCGVLERSISRAFAAFADNHPHISFTDVSHAASPAAVANAEILLTVRAPNASAAIFDDDEAAAMVPYARLTNTFRSTNGLSHVLKVGSLLQPRQTIEVYGGRIEFDDTPSTCWYVDSHFCAPFNFQKRSTSPSSAAAGGGAFIMLPWLLLMGGVCYDFAWRVRTIIRHRREQLAQLNAGSKEFGSVAASQENLYWRVQAVLGAIHSMSLIGASLRLYLIMVPWAFYQSIVIACFECHDFEAAAAHQIGHLLGLAHPNMPAGAQLEPEYASSAAAHNLSANYYNGLLAGGGVMNASNCLHVWDEVRAGVPEGVVYEERGGRTSMMERFTGAHLPTGACLRQDDYEALLTLYPVCATHGVPTAPVCNNAPLNLGLLAVLTAVSAPFLLAIVTAAVLKRFTRLRLGSLGEQTNHGLGSRAKSLVSRTRIGLLDGIDSTTTPAAASSTAAAAAAADASSGAAGVGIVSIEANEETEGAAARIQARYRGKKSRGPEAGGPSGGGDGDGAKKATKQPKPSPSASRYIAPVEEEEEAAPTRAPPSMAAGGGGGATEEVVELGPLAIALGDESVPTTPRVPAASERPTGAAPGRAVAAAPSFKIQARPGMDVGFELRMPTG